MTEIDDIRRFLDQGFRAAMMLHEPTKDEIRRLPEVYSRSLVVALPLAHPDGRRVMYYLRDPAAIDLAKQLVAQQNEIIGYDLCIYSSAIGPDTILGHKLFFWDELVNNLRELLEWDVAVSEYPHTFEVSFKIEGDDQAAIADRLAQVRKVALALSLRNQLGFVVGGSSPGPKYQGQPFSLKAGLIERAVRGLSACQLAYIDNIWGNQDALDAAEALQQVYSQVSDDSRITVGWAAIEHIFASPARHLLTPEELESAINAVAQLEAIPTEKRDRLKQLLRNPDLVSEAGRNERLARNISERAGIAFGDVLDNVRSLAQERGRRVHRLPKNARPPAQLIAFVETVLWTVIEAAIDGANPFRDGDGRKGK